ncbi:MAG: YgfZ/GcvT domain-containing protein [Devosia sp.]
MPTILRPDRVAFRFAGPDAQHLLFDVITGRILAEPGPARWWALLSPQGKVQCEGLWSWHDDAFWLDVDTASAEAFFKRMRMYRLRARVEIEPLGESHAVGWAEAPVTGVLSDSDGRAEGLGYRIIAPREAALVWADHPERPARLRIATGIAEQGPDFAPDSQFPHDLGMDLLGGVDFAKGCYIGQEVVSRMQHRGTARRRPVIVSGLGDAEPGAAVVVEGKEAGSIGKPAGDMAVAILRLDRITDPSAATLNGLPVTLTLPGWATYRFGESPAAD